MEFTTEGRYQIVSDLTDVYIFLVAVIRFGIPYDVFSHVRSELEKIIFCYCFSTEFFIVRVTSVWSL